MYAPLTWCRNHLSNQTDSALSARMMHKLHNVHPPSACYFTRLLPELPEPMLPAVHGLLLLVVIAVIFSTPSVCLLNDVIQIEPPSDAIHDILPITVTATAIVTLWVLYVVTC